MLIIFMLQNIINDINVIINYFIVININIYYVFS